MSGEALLALVIFLFFLSLTRAADFSHEIHDFLLHRSWLAAYHAASDFFDRHFGGPWK
jgi:hypothetical protein